MAVIRFAQREVEAKIVYWGPALSGKTTNLRFLHTATPDRQKGELHTLNTSDERTLFFDYLPLQVGTVAGFHARFKLFSVPGQIFYRETRRMVLRGADAVVFVADSAEDRLSANIESLRDLEQAMEEMGRTLESTPFIIQYNKRDLNDALPLAVMNVALNPRKVQHAECVALDGVGVIECLQAITELVSGRVSRDLAGGSSTPQLKVSSDGAASDSEEVHEHLKAISRVRPGEDRKLKAHLAQETMPFDAQAFAHRFPAIKPGQDETERDDDVPSDRIIFLPPVRMTSPGRRGAAPPPAAPVRAGSSPAIDDGNDLPWEGPEWQGRDEVPSAAPVEQPRRAMAWADSRPAAAPAPPSAAPTDGGRSSPRRDNPPLSQRVEPPPRALVPQVDLRADVDATISLGGDEDEAPPPQARLSRAAPPPASEPPGTAQRAQPVRGVRSGPPSARFGDGRAFERRVALGRSMPERQAEEPESLPETESTTDERRVLQMVEIPLPFLPRRLVGHRASRVNSARLAPDGTVEVHLTMTSRMTREERPVVVRLMSHRREVDEVQSGGRRALYSSLVLVVGILIGVLGWMLATRTVPIVW